ncbi:hypothetical protein DFH08DRAFT_811913 [Mycena albidolilacea]|uniref:Uncharacterized protein n=1 Tax=Mycena albidolilacea TaxID=1033008 RepID=A0AAD7EMN7_9AGAR|nr:hypothetical protein DFH08DRAFT_811913 [Mycena albidolilacea]
MTIFTTRKDSRSHHARPRLVATHSPTGPPEQAAEGSGESLGVEAVVDRHGLPRVDRCRPAGPSTGPRNAVKPNAKFYEFSDCTLFVRGSAGQICVDLVPGGIDLYVYSLPIQTLDEKGLESLILGESSVPEATIIESLTLEDYR